MEIFGDFALVTRYENSFQVDRDPSKAIANRIELLFEKLRDARKNMNVLQNDDREPEVAHIDDARSFGHERHFLHRIVQRLLLGALNARADLVVQNKSPVEGLGDRLHGDVIVGGPDATGSKDVIVGFAKTASLFGNRIHNVGNHEDALEIDAQLPQLAGQKWGIRIHDFPRKNLVANH